MVRTDRPPPDTLLQKMYLREAAGDRVDEEILGFLQRELPNIWYRNEDDRTYGIASVARRSREFQFTITSEAPAARARPEPTLSRVVAGIAGRMVLSDGPDHDCKLVSRTVEGGCELSCE
jgi:hypothetical protein